MRASPPPGVRCLTTIGTRRPAWLSSSSIRKPRSAGMCSKTMSMTWWSTSSTGRTAISVSATLVRTLRIRLDFSISWTSTIGAFFSSRGAPATGAAVSRRESSPTERMMVPASSERGFASSRTTLLSRALLKVSSNLPRRIRSPSRRGASTTGTPFTCVPFLDLRSRMRALPSSPTRTFAWFREMP